MTISDRRVRDVFVELTDTLVDDFDIIDFLDRLAARCVELLGVAACGLLLVDHRGKLNLLAASTEQARLLELLQLQGSQGPCLETYHGGRAVHCLDLAGAEATVRWPRFAAAAAAAGFTSVHALPMRLRTDVIGAMNLFSAGQDPPDGATIELGQSLANAATIGILHQRALHHREMVAEQLQGALNSRILIEQAKGFVAERQGVSVDEAFDVLREHARTNNRKLLDVAEAVIAGRLSLPSRERVRNKEK
ncbi:GAF and ANTAR domain-containing protein [Actinoallomurus sp. NPDC050550]|uniref:GAF and ANTAR domain-containing protein n=1 Tax=Actinoallomurus sp. NPDC050550 TaxID=3154937 RepID=UPI0033D8A98D